MKAHKLKTIENKVIKRKRATKGLQAILLVTSSVDVNGFVVWKSAMQLCSRRHMLFLCETKNGKLNLGVVKYIFE